MSAKSNSEIAVIGSDVGKNSFHIVGLRDTCSITSSGACWSCLDTHSAVGS